MENYKKHRLYAEFEQQLKDDADFSATFDNNETDFLEWALAYETDDDWKGGAMTLHDNISWCVSRLVDNYEWQGIIEYDDWLRLQSLLAEALCADSKLAEHIVNVCLTEGIIEE